MLSRRSVQNREATAGRMGSATLNTTPTTFRLVTTTASNMIESSISVARTEIPDTAAWEASKHTSVSRRRNRNTASASTADSTAISSASLRSMLAADPSK